jgi:hypothetical protein
MSEQQFQINLDRTANVPLSEGMHTFQISAGTEGEGQKGPYWKFDLVCLTPGDEDKAPKPLFVSLTPQARWRLEIFLDAVGAPSSGAATIDKFIGRKFRGQVKHETYEGRLQATVSDLFPLTSAKPVTTNTAKPVVVKKVSSAPAAAAPKSTGLPADAGEEEEPPF